MLRKRIIFTLIYANGFFNQSRNFRLQKVGSLTWLEKNYKFQEIAFSLDELIVLNASKGEKDLVMFAETLSHLVDDVFIPIAAGGGIRSLSDAKLLFENGADKLVINSILYEDTKLVKELVRTYGAQSLVANIDYKDVCGEKKAFIHDGKTEIPISLVDYIKEIEALNVGEIYLNSIEQDGSGFGYDIKTISSLNEIKIPIILAGGAGNEKHLEEGLVLENTSAVATANLFNFIGNGLPNARVNILKNGINIAKWIKC